VKAKIITNNVKVSDKYNNKYDVEFVDGSYLDVLVLARNKIHEGYKLLTHPLSGSVKPNETPYKSLVISYEKEDLHIDSLMIIEESIHTAQKFISIKSHIKWNDEILEDFMEIDSTLLDSGIESMRQFR